MASVLIPKCPHKIEVWHLKILVVLRRIFLEATVFFPNFRLYVGRECSLVALRSGQAAMFSGVAMWGIFWPFGRGFP